MGRHTFEKVLTFKEWPYKIPVVVLSTTAHEVPEHLKHKVRLASSTPIDLVKQLAAEGQRHLYIDGGITIQRFLRARLIHEITVTYIPVLLGAGIPLFGSTGTEMHLKLLEVTSSKNGFVQVRYEVAAQQELILSGVRGKFARQFREGSNVVLIDPDLARAFPNAKAVNDALRQFLVEHERSAT